jgi:hypothetical protein
MQGAETTNVHPGLGIQDHEQGTLRSVCLAVDSRRLTPHSGRTRAQRAETDLHLRSYGERHMRYYAGRQGLLGQVSGRPLDLETRWRILAAWLAKEELCELLTRSLGRRRRRSAWFVDGWAAESRTSRRDGTHDVHCLVTNEPNNVRSIALQRAPAD